MPQGVGVRVSPSPHISGLRGLPLGPGLEELLFFSTWLLGLRVLWRVVASVSGVLKENGCSLPTHGSNATGCGARMFAAVPGRQGVVRGTYVHF